jgi:tape measure domain-containing protein
VALSEILAKLRLDESEFRKGIQRLRSETAVFGEIGTNLSLALSAPIAAAGAFSLNSFKEFDSLRRGLDVMTGSVTATKERLKELREIAKQPGLSFQEAIQGDVRLRAVGVSAAQSAKILKEFGNAIATTGGGGVELRSVTVQLGQLIAKGKVFAQDLKPIIEAAPAVGKALKEIYGEVDSENIQKILESSGKSSKDFVDELLAKLSEAPRVTGGFKNSLENLKDSLFVFGSTLGESVNNVFNLDTRISALSDRISGLAVKFESLPESMQKIILNGVGITAAIGPALVIFSKMAGVIQVVTAAFKNLTSEKALLGSAIRSLDFKLILGGLDGLSKRIPLLAAATVVATAVFRNWESISKVLAPVLEYLGELFKPLVIILKGLISVLKEVDNVIKFVFEGLVKSVETATKLVYNKIGNIGLVIKAAIKGDFTLAGLLIQAGQANDISIIKQYGKDIGLQLVDSLSTNLPKINSPIKGSQDRFGNVRNTKANVAAPVLPISQGSKNDPIGDTIKRLQEDLNKINALSGIYGSSFDAIGEKIGAYQKAIDGLAGSKDGRALAGIKTALQDISNLMPKTAVVKPLETLTEKLSGVGAEIKSLSGVSLGAKLGDDILKMSTPLQVISSEFENIDRIANGLGPSFNALGEKIKVLEDLFKSGKISANEYGAGLSGLATQGKIQKEIFNDFGFALADSLKGVSVQIASQSEVAAAVANLNSELVKQQEILRDPTATEAQQKAAYAQIAILQKQMQVERDKANVVKQTSKAVYQAIRETLRAYLAEAIAASIASSFKKGGLLGAVLGGLGAAAAIGLFEAFVPKLAKGGLAFGPQLALVGDNKNAKNDPEVIAPLSKLAQYFNGGEKDQTLNSKLYGLDLLLSNRLSASYYTRVA